MDALWGERPPESANASLQVYVHGLRRALGAERIVTVGTGYRVRLEPGELDVERFEQLLERADRALDRNEPSSALEDVNAALALWRGSPPVPHLDELRLRALELRGSALLALGEHDVLLPDLDQLIADHPYRERLREQQMLALYRAGRQKDALDAYRGARATLLDELGVDPGPALQELERSILRHDPALQAPAAAPPAPIRLPAPATPLVGRRLEIAAVESLLRAEARLVTLTGPGGTGKTRLALAVAEAFAPGLRDGAAFVDLSSVTTADAVLPVVARGLGVADADEGVETAVFDHLRERSLLLVLDNLEQLGAQTQPVGAMLSAAPRLRVLATSRVPLRLSGEHDYPVPPLPVPELGHDRFEELVANDAVRLFAARARAADPGFALTGDNVGSVVGVCRRLDGLPLALELAATWVKVLAPPEIEQRLARALDLLVSGARDLPERQQTLRATLDWSYDLLDDRDRRLLADLSVFQGGWTLADADAVVGEPTTAGIATLVDHSLVRRRGERFTMLETIREYAAERLGKRALGLRRRHAARFFEIAQGARAGMLEGGDAETAAFALLDAEIENMRAALDSFQEWGEVEQEARVAVALRWYWLVRGSIAEGTRIFERIAAVSGDRPAAHADALSGAGVFNMRRGERARATEQLGEARALYAELGDDDEEGRCIAELGALAVDDGDLARAADLYRQSIELFERQGNVYRLGVAFSNLAAIAVRRGEADAAAGYSERAIALQRETDDLGGLGVSLANLGRVQLLAGDVGAGRASLREAIEIATRLDYRMLLAYLLGSAGDLAALEAAPEEAARYVGAAMGLFETIGMPIPPEEVDEHERTLAPIRASLGNARVEQFLHQGRDASTDQMIEAARKLI